MECHLHDSEFQLHYMAINKVHVISVITLKSALLSIVYDVLMSCYVIKLKLST